MSAAPSQHEQETAGGRFVDLLLPRPELIALDDVAHHLSQAVRFAGAPGRPDGRGGREPVHYSVAEHAVLVAEKLAAEGHPGLSLPGVHHDDEEAFLGDQTRQLKILLRQLADESHDLTWDGIEEGVALACWRSLSTGGRWLRAEPLWRFEDQRHELVKAADTWAAVLEARLLLPSEGRGWTQERLAAAWDLDGRWTPTDDELRTYAPLGAPAPEAKRMYLAVHKGLAAIARTGAEAT